MRRGVVLVLALVLAGCGGGERGQGTATLWVTRDKGARVVLSTTVPAGLDGIRTVERKLNVTTRYGGRYVQSISGVEGSLAAQRDWFYYVNGKEGNRSAGEVTIRDGDVLWWDYRRWSPATEHVPVVAGAWPHPFVDGGGTSVVSADRDVARKLAAQVHGVVNAKRAVRNFVVVGKYAPDHVRIKEFGNGYVLELGPAIAKRLADDPSALRYRF